MKTILRVLPLLLLCSVGLFAQTGYDDPVTPFVNKIWAILSGALVSIACIWFVVSLLSAAVTQGRLLVAAVSALGCVWFLLHVQRIVNYLAA